MILVDAQRVDEDVLLLWALQLPLQLVSALHTCHISLMQATPGVHYDSRLDPFPRSLVMSLPVTFVLLCDLRH